MKYIDFYQKFKGRPLVDSQEISLLFPDFDYRRLTEWQEQGYIKKLARGFYIFSDAKLGDAEKSYIANKLFEPSYISLEYALSYYSFIPETVQVLTSVTTRKTKIVNTMIGSYQYRSVKEELFFGYRLVKSGSITFKMAEPEKALLDFFYLCPDIKNKNDIDELRLDLDMLREKIDCQKLERYLAEFNSATLCRKMKIVIKKF